MNKDAMILLSGFLTSLLLFLGTINVELSWFNKESINAFVVLVGSLIALVLNLYAVWKNTHTNWFKKNNKKDGEK